MRLHPSLLASLLAFFPASAYSLGFRLADMDAFATGRGDAFAATADNASAVYYNPAGLTQLDGLSLRLGAYGIWLRDEFEPSAEGGRRTETPEELQTAPHFFVAYRPRNHPIALGFGSYAPYGLGLEFPDDAQFRSLARRGVIAYLTMNPVVAVQVSRTFSVAAGFTVNYVQAELERGISEPGDSFRFQGGGVAYGFTLGALWQPLPQHSFGIKYHSATDVPLSGHTSARLTDRQRAAIREGNAAIREARTQFGAAADADLTARGIPLTGYPENFPEEDADADLHFPQFIVLGYSFRPTPAWNFEINVDWTDWDSLNIVTLHQQISPDAPLPFNYTSSILWEFGATRTFTNGFRVSAGYIFSENSVPDSAFSPGVPDSDRHLFTLGLGKKAGQGGRYSWDVAYQLGYGPSRDIDNDSLAAGRYEFLSHAFTVTLGYNF